MNFQYNYNLSGAARKPLVEAVSQILSCTAVYQGAPSFAYTVGGCVVDRNGVLTLPDNIKPETARFLVETLQEQGFIAENMVTETVAENSIHIENTTEDIELTVEIPDTGFTPEARENLRKIIASKETLLKRALGTEHLPIIETEGKIAFPWFTMHGIDDEADAYNRLIAGICKMAKTQKRITATEKPIENAKFTMRLFLIRLGFIGDEYKTARKILLRNLTGNSSWKSRRRPEQPAEITEDSSPTEDEEVTEKCLHSAAPIK